MSSEQLERISEPQTVGTAKTLLIPAIVCAFLSVAFMRTGFLALFFLVPPGFCAVAFGSAAAWLCFVFASVGNGILAAGISLYYGVGLPLAGKDILYFVVIVLGFTWIMAGNPPGTEQRIPKIRTAYRFVIAAALGAVMFLVVTFAGSGNEALLSLIFSQAEAVSEGMIASSGMDAARQSLLQNVLTPENVMQTLLAVMLRGGALFSAFFVFFFSRQAAFLLARLLRRLRANTTGDLTGFYAPRRVIWVFPLSLLAVIIGRVISVEAIEIVSWNLLVVCAVMFLAQGGGIVLFTLTRRPMPTMFRLLLMGLLVVVIFSPVNVFILGALVLLGIAENWLPMRRVANEQ
jgi:hypothetical protein